MIHFDLNLSDSEALSSYAKSCESSIGVRESSMLRDSIKNLAEEIDHLPLEKMALEK